MRNKVVFPARRGPVTISAGKCRAARMSSDSINRGMNRMASLGRAPDLPKEKRLTEARHQDCSITAFAGAAAGSQVQTLPPQPPKIQGASRERRLALFVFGGA